MSTPYPLDHLRVEIAPGAVLSADPETWPWVDITEFIHQKDDITYTSGQRDEAQSVIPSVVTLTVDNTDGRFSPRNPLGPWFGQLSLNTPLRLFWDADPVSEIVFVSEWPPRWDRTAIQATVVVTADGITRRLKQGAQALDSPLFRSISTHPNVVAYWPCEDERDATEAASPLMGVPAMRPSANVEFGASNDGLPGASSVLRIGEDSRNVLGRVPNHTPGDVYLISEAWRIDETPTAPRAVMDVYTTSGDLARWQFRLSGSVFQVRAWDGEDSVVLNETESLHSRLVGQWVRPVLQLEQRGSQVYWSAAIYTIDSSQTILQRLDAGLSTITANMGRVTLAGVNGPGMFQDRFAGHITVATGDAVDDPWLGAAHPVAHISAVQEFASSAMGRSPRGVAWDGAAFRNADTDTDVVYRFDPIDGSFLDSFFSPTDDPQGLTWDGTHLRLVDSDANEILRLDPDDGSVADSISTPDTAPLGLTWDGEALWLADDPAGTIYRLDPSDGSVLDSITGPSSSHRDLAWDGEALWAINSDGSVVYRLDPSDGSVLGSFDWEPGDARGIAWDGVCLWLASEHAFPDFSQFYRLAVLAEYSAADGFNGEPAAFRLQRLCQEEGIASEIVGDALDSMPMGPQQVDTLVANLLDVPVTDGGRLSEHEGGFSYRVRTDLYNQDDALALDNHGRLSQPPEPTDDDQQLRNDVTAQSPFGTSARAADQDSVDRLGRYDTSLSVNPETSDQLLQIAHWAVHLGTVDDMRWPRIDLALHKDPDLIPAWLALRFGDRITLDQTLSQLPGIDVDQLIIGSSQRFTRFAWDVALNCVPAAPYTVFTVEDDTLGRVGTAGSLTVGSFDAGQDTSLDVTTGTDRDGLRLWGGAGAYVTTPDHASLDITGDLDVRCELTTDWRSVADGAFSALVAKWELLNQHSFTFVLDQGGTLRLFWTENGSTNLSEQSDEAVSFVTGRGAVRATLDVDDGGDHTVTFYTADTLAGPWTQLGTAQTSGGTTSVFSSASEVSVGAHDGGTGRMLRGVVHAAAVCDGIDGTVVADPDFSVQPAGTTGFDDDAGRTWTVQGTARIFHTPLWITTASHSAMFPFDIEIAGVVLRVTGISGTDPEQTFTVAQEPVNGIEKTIPSGSTVRLAARAAVAL